MLRTEKSMDVTKMSLIFSCKKKEEELDFKVYFGKYFGTAIHTCSIKFEAHFTFIFRRQIIMFVMMTANYSIK